MTESSSLTETIKARIKECEKTMSKVSSESYVYEWAQIIKRELEALLPLAEKQDKAIAEIKRKIQGLQLIQYYCQDCGELMSLSNYDCHDDDHSVTIQSVIYDADRVVKIIDEELEGKNQ